MDGAPGRSLGDPSPGRSRRDDKQKDVGSGRQLFRCGWLGGCFFFGLCVRWLIEVVEVEDRVEHQIVAADRLSAIDRVVCEEKYIARAEVCVHYDCMLGD